MSGSGSIASSYSSSVSDSGCEEEHEAEYSDHSGSQYGRHEQQEYNPKNPLLIWSEKTTAAIPIDLQASGSKGFADEQLLVTDELLFEVDRDVERGLTFSNDQFLVKVFKDKSDPLLYRLAFCTLSSKLFSHSLVIFDLLIPPTYPSTPPILTSPHTSNRLLTEVISLLLPPSNNADIDVEQNRLDKIILRASEVMNKDYNLPIVLGVRSQDVESFNFIAILLKIKCNYKDIFFNALDSPDLEWRDFVLMHCSRHQSSICRHIEELHDMSGMDTESPFFKEWVENSPPFYGKFNMDIVDDLYNILENISFVPTVPILEWADSADLEPLPTELYERALRQFRYNSYSLLDENGEYRHALKRYLANKTTMEHKTKRFLNEMKALSHGLPCTAPNSIFVVADSTRMDVMKALISGPSDTPYAHGLFMFDILCTEEYPHSPPKVNIVTTGNGTLRFNPNLYSDGFVCLSIINTWDGDPEERWNPSRSNLLQVLVSIQSLVMDDHVIHKEPGYEDYEVAYPGNVVYSNIVRYGTIKYAMLELLTNTPPEFKEVVLQHFTLKKKDILRTVKGWLDTARDERIDQATLDPLLKDHNRKIIKAFNSEGYYKLLEEVAVSLKAQLDMLPDVNSEADLEALSQFARETVCNYHYRPAPSGENSEEDHGSADDEEEIITIDEGNADEAEDDFYNKFNDKLNQSSVDLINSSRPHAYHDLPTGTSPDFVEELNRISDYFDLYSRTCVFVQYSHDRYNLWRLVCCIPTETCLSNGILVFDAFVTGDGVYALRLLNFQGMKLYSFIDSRGEVDLVKVKKSSKSLSVERALRRVMRMLKKEEKDASIETQLLLYTLNMKFCMIEIFQNPWSNLEYVRELLQAKKDEISDDISRVFEIMDEESESTGLKREIELENPHLMLEIERRGSLKDCFQETFGLLISTLNN
mmetsp:Transcript_10839/g.21190  ORF Transcript_10839/g.21190 Transcript_10839/m.21190 type:complete len:930 (-) Transcript_10839:2081-4870(-)